jgi:Mg2+ and Co2+ transporter CorA
MSHFLENDAMRRQNETVVRLTVVTIFGLIGTVVTGFLGMNLFALAEESALTRLLIFALITLPTILLTLYTVKKSPRLSEFLDALSDDTLPLRAKWRAFLRVW